MDQTQSPQAIGSLDATVKAQDRRLRKLLRTTGQQLERGAYLQSHTQESAYLVESKERAQKLYVVRDEGNA